MYKHIQNGWEKQRHFHQMDTMSATAEKKWLNFHGFVCIWQRRWTKTNRDFYITSGIDSAAMHGQWPFFFGELCNFFRKLFFSEQSIRVWFMLRSTLDFLLTFAQFFSNFCIFKKCFQFISHFFSTFLFVSIFHLSLFHSSIAHKSVQKCIFYSCKLQSHQMIAKRISVKMCHFCVYFPWIQLATASKNIYAN